MAVGTRGSGVNCPPPQYFANQKKLGLTYKSLYSKKAKIDT